MKTETINRLIGDLDDEALSCEFEAKASRPRKAFRFAAAAAALLIVAGAAFGIAQAKALANNGEKLPAQYAFMADTSVPKDAVLPPARTGQLKSSAEYAGSYTIPSAYSEAEAVCLARVGNWLGENEYDSFFEAEPLVTYKGELPSSFILWELGNSKSTLGTPVFTYGDVLLLFLIREDCEEYSGAYACIGGDLTMLYASVDNDGNAYLIDHRGIFSYKTSEEYPEIELADFGTNKLLVSELCSNMSVYDKFMADALERYCNVSINDRPNVPFPLHVYSLEEFEDVFFGQ